MPRTSRPKFTKHALEKLRTMKHYGFRIRREQVVTTVLNPQRLEQRGGQCFATRGINSEHALRVVFEKRKDYLLVITFYPVRRDRYGV